MNPWLVFKGKTVNAGAGKTRLIGEGGGELEVATEDVSVKNGEVRVHVGARVKVTKHPAQKNTQVKPDTLMVTEGDCDRTACIGAVEICCGSGRILRACIGVWSC